jgi:hypothetical protein
MLYRKNLPTWERILRVCSALLLAAAGLYFPLGALFQWLLLGSAGMALVTGFLGFCPMCAVAGRKSTGAG